MSKRKQYLDELVEIAGMLEDICNRSDLDMLEYNLFFEGEDGLQDIKDAAERTFNDLDNYLYDQKAYNGQEPPK